MSKAGPRIEAASKESAKKIAKRVAALSEAEPAPVQLFRQQEREEGPSPGRVR